MQWRYSPVCSLFLLLGTTGILVLAALWGKEFSVPGLRLHHVSGLCHGPRVGLATLSGTPVQLERTQSLAFSWGDGFSLTHLTSSLCRVLLCKRQESRPAEWMAQQFLGVVARVFPTAYSVPVETVARAMMASVLQPGKGKVEVLENGAIHELGKAVLQQGM